MNMTKSTFERVMEDPKQKGAFLKLQKALAEGERTAELSGWLSAADVRKKF